MKFTQLLFAFLFTTTLFGQSDISGTVVDTTGTTLPGANAILYRTADSLLTSFGTTDGKGNFLMEDVPVGEYYLQVSFLGYERPNQDITVGEGDQFLGLGDLTLYPAGFLLDGVEVTADRIPIRMVGDTMMYDADAFQVGENAAVEDLLRRLPGMSIDANGQITWRGKVVQEVMINGKPFFAGNSTLITQNLDAKALKNVEVYDQKSDAEELSGIDDGQENTTINLEMKDEFKAKIFGELYAGYGTQDRYDGGGKLFRISDASQIGVLGTINNVNRVGFTGDELADFNGSLGRGRWNRGGGTNGLPTAGDQTPGQNRSLAAGLNYGRGFGENGQLTLGYSLFDRRQTQAFTLEQAFNRQNNERTTRTLQTDESESYNHAFTVEVRQRQDTTARYRLSGNLTLNGSENGSDARTFVEGEEYTVNQFANTEGPRGSVRGNYNRRLGKAGRTFGVNGNASFRANDTDEATLTQGLTEELAIPGALINGRQDQLRRINTFNSDLGLNYDEPFGDRWRLNLESNLTVDRATSEFDINFNGERLENALDRNWTAGDASVGMTYAWKPGSSLNFGGLLSSGTLEISGDDRRRATFTRLFPVVGANFRTEKGFYFASLRGYQQAPDIAQLQTIATPNPSGRISVGNPNLTPASEYSFQLYHWFNDQFNAISANVGGYGSYTDNAFGNSVTFNRGQQIYQTVNVSHAWQGNLNAGATIGVSAIRGEVRAEGNLGSSIGQGFVDGVAQTNVTNNLSAGGNVTTELNEQSFFKAGYTYGRNSNRFTGEEETTIETVTHDLLAQFELEVSPKWRFESRFLYRIFEAAAFTGQTDIGDLRASLEVRPFKTAGHYITLTGMDLLNQNTVINRQASAFVTSETTSDALGRYLLVAFHWKL